MTLMYFSAEDDGKPQILVLPVPVPVFIPVPMHLYTQFAPVPLSFPLPVSLFFGRLIMLELSCKADLYRARTYPHSLRSARNPVLSYAVFFL